MLGDTIEPRVRRAMSEISGIPSHEITDQFELCRDFDLDNGERDYFIYALQEALEFTFPNGTTFTGKTTYPEIVAAVKAALGVAA